MDIKLIVLAGLIPIITSLSPAAGKEISDIQLALADGKFSEGEVVTLVKDSINTAKSFWAAGSQVLDDVGFLIIELHSGLEPDVLKLIADVKALKGN